MYVQENDRGVVFYLDIAHPIPLAFDFMDCPDDSIRLPCTDLIQHSKDLILR